MAKKVMEELDQDKDGTMNFMEYCNLITTLSMIVHMIEGMAKKVMKQLDDDEDGTMDFTEYCSLITTLSMYVHMAAAEHLPKAPFCIVLVLLVEVVLIRELVLLFLCLTARWPTREPPAGGGSLKYQKVSFLLVLLVEVVLIRELVLLFLCLTTRWPTREPPAGGGSLKYQKEGMAKTVMKELDEDEDGTMDFMEYCTLITGLSMILHMTLSDQLPK
ncbi:hypothetical protein NHX12_024275 [Muraenolepis orangiensis]|uniref:EF-hand domain-containing protein n=1 Tax=Muraenolepis orangiensis TaxID=630683 RepID=A0A9Q0EMD6_9TELE|nr:hypothetical protein NHX12_024275 [Muraenolepis orangiensis]